MSYWICRLVRNTGELITEKRMPRDVNIFDCQPPNIGERITIQYEGMPVLVEVIWCTQVRPVLVADFVALADYHLRVQEVRPQPTTWQGRLFDWLSRTIGIIPRGP